MGVTQQISQGVVEENPALPLWGVEPRAAEDLAGNVVHSPAFRKVMSVIWNCQFIKTIFFQEKVTLGTPSVTNSRILLTRLPRNSWARLKSHLPAFKPVFFYSVPFSKTFHIFEDNNRVSTALSSQSLFCVLSLLWTVSGFSTLKKKPKNNGGGRNRIQFFNNGLISTVYTRKMTSGFLHHCEPLEGKNRVWFIFVAGQFVKPSGYFINICWIDSSFNISK